MAVPKRLHPRPVQNQALPTEAELHEVDLRFVTTMITHLRNNGNMADYEATFPAAVAVRDHLGHAHWESLERFREHMATLCVQTRRLDRECLQVEQESLNRFLPVMRAWILREFGQIEVERFDQAHAVRNAGNTAEFRRWFHHNPTLWLVYNHFFAAGERKDTPQQMQWLLWTLQHPQRPCVHEPCAVWDSVVAEVYQTLMALPNEFELEA